jgi:hypothetical protein
MKQPMKNLWIRLIVFIFILKMVRIIFSEMEVTEIIFAKASRLCQLSSHRRGFLSDLRFLNPYGQPMDFFPAQSPKNPKLKRNWGLKYM